MPTTGMRICSNLAAGLQPASPQDLAPPDHGIWQPVWFEQRPSSHIADLTSVPNVPKARLSLAVRVHGASAGQRLLRVRLVPIDELISDDGHEVVGDDVRRDVALTTIGMTPERERMLWTPSAPTSSTPAAPQQPGRARARAIRLGCRRRGSGGVSMPGIWSFKVTASLSGGQALAVMLWGPRGVTLS